MSDCSNIVKAGVGAAQPGSQEVPFLFPTAKTGAEAPERSGVHLQMLAMCGDRKPYVSSFLWLATKTLTLKALFCTLH